MFKKKKVKITKLLNDLESNEDYHTEALEKEAKYIQGLHTKLNVENVVISGVEDPDFDIAYGDTVDTLGRAN